VAGLVIACLEPYVAAKLFMIFSPPATLRLTWPSLRNVFVFSGLLLWLLAPTLAGIWFEGSRHGPGWTALTLVAAFSLFLSPLLLTGSWRRTFLLWLPVAMLAPIVVFLTFFFQGVPGDPLTSSLLHTNPREVLETLGGFGWYPYLIPLTWLAYLLLVWQSASLPALSKPRRQHLLMALVLYVLLAVLPDPGKQSAKLLPALFDADGLATIFPVSSMLSLNRVLDVQPDDLTIRKLGASAPPEPQLIVLVIGETLRPDHLGINGYERDTTPRLSALRGSLLSFSNVASTANFTAYAIRNMLLQTDRAGSVTLVSAFREASFQTAWVSNQDRPIYMPGTDFTFIANTSWATGTRYDDSILPVVNTSMQLRGERRLIVVHIMGSHFPYDLRYGAQDAVFQPAFGGKVKASISLGKKQELINAYDNSIRATDRFVAEVIAKANANERPALVMFTADHGENLYDDERNLVLHSGVKPSRAEAFVPLIVWANEAYQARNPDKMAAMKQNLHAPISHLDIMPSLLDLASVTYPGRQPERSFGSPSFVPRASREVFPNKGGPPVDADALR
jgi:glucan phosphoethanolaminetransferase (alkaline phosphatase superfamily)